jgi:hypothetical protein
MDLEELLDAPGDRIPLLTAGEAHVALCLLSPLAAGADAVAEAAEELITRLACHLPEPPT